jgi:predicted CXXCH cytochrome family protein
MVKKCFRKSLSLLSPRMAWLLFAFAFAASHGDGGATPVQAAVNRDAVCASCHREIYDRYMKTPMAQASGPAIDGMVSVPANFVHKASGVHYQITESGGHVYLDYDRPEKAKGGQLHGQEELLYFVGSGTRGRTFLFQREGYWFETPINWYAKKGIWDMAPSYQRVAEMPLTLAADSGCLSCHASNVQPALPEARNRYRAAPFETGGIRCERCHNDASEHVAQGGKGPILNPDKLAANLRDSICLQCHLEAEVSVNRPGHSLYDFLPGKEISDYLVYFVHRDALGADGRATSQWEALLQSACKRGSGDKLTCTTCHDPHGAPPAQESVTFYRNKCLACHTDTRYATRHHSEQPDCANCHMPRGATKDIAHEQVTDHRIQIQQVAMLEDLGGPNGGRGRSEELVTVRGTASSRDLGIAYSQLALHGDRQAGQQALRLLREAERDLSTNPSSLPDADLHTQLGFLEQSNGDAANAAREYRLAIAANPFDAVAMGNTALIEAKGGDLKSAAGLWASAFEYDPTQNAAAVNLASTYCELGDKVSATRVLDRLLLFSPDNRQARQFAAAIADGSQTCRRP